MKERIDLSKAHAVIGERSAASGVGEESSINEVACSRPGGGQAYLLGITIALPGGVLLLVP